MDVGRERSRDLGRVSVTSTLARASSDSFQPPLPLIGDADLSERKKKICSLYGWLLSFPLAELSSNTPPEPGLSLLRGRKILSTSRSHPTASQRLRHGPPPMNHTISTPRTRSNLQYLAGSPTQNLQNSQVFQLLTLPPPTRRHVPSVQAPALPNTPPVQLTVKRGT